MLEKIKDWEISSQDSKYCRDYKIRIRFNDYRKAKEPSRVHSSEWKRKACTFIIKLHDDIV